MKHVFNVTILQLIVLLLFPNIAFAQQNSCSTASAVPDYAQVDKNIQSNNSPDLHPEFRGWSALTANNIKMRLAIRGRTNFVQSDKKIQFGKSLFIDSQKILNPPDVKNKIKFSEIMNQLAKQANGSDAGASGATLFADWWASAAPHDLGKKNGPYGCNFNSNKKGTYEQPIDSKLINGMRYTCPRLEGTFSKLKSLTIPSDNNQNDSMELFKIIAIVNRGDLAEAKPPYDTCGEFRIIAQSNLHAFNELPKKLTVDKSENHYISLEFGLRNSATDTSKKPELCRAIQKFWYDLGSIDTSEPSGKNKLSGKLKHFFFYSTSLLIDNKKAVTFGPIIHINNLGFPKPNSKNPDTKILGQIRTNTKPKGNTLASSPNTRLALQWIMRQYQFRKTKDNKIRIVPTNLPAVLAPEMLEKNKNNTLLDDIKSNVSNLFSTEFKKAGYNAEKCLQASEVRLGNQTPTRSYPIVAYDTNGHRDLIPDTWSGQSKKKIASKVKNLLKQMVGSDTDKETIPFANMEFRSCSGCHGALRAKDIKHLNSDNIFNPNALNPNKKLAQFTHTKKDSSSSFKSDFLSKILLPWRCIVMKEQLKALTADDLNSFINRQQNLLKAIDDDGIGVKALTPSNKANSAFFPDNC